MTQGEAETVFREACDRLRDGGFNVVAVVSRYDADGAHFMTRFALHGDEAQQDHAVLDAHREIAVEWSNGRHDAKLVWQEPQ